MEKISYQQKIKHLYWRAGCGPSLDEFNSKESINKHIDKIFNDAKTFTPIVLSQIRKEQQQNGGKDEMAITNNKTASNRREERVKLGYITVEKLATTDAFLREKMAFFWSNHFACQTNFSPIGLDYINIIRQHALGNFADLLMATCKSAAIITFLNTKKNKKKSPNENFARELMELFTLGRGYYTETDVKEAARAFTGWSFNKKLKFYVNKPYQDTGVKTFLGKTGNLSGDDVIDIILSKKQCARFITQKIYRYFVNEKPDNNRIEKLADDFFKSGYSIEKLMRDIFSADWFYEKENIGNRIKSPVDLLAGMMKSCTVRMHDESRFLAFMRMTGQVIFQPPNVAGWPTDRAWIDNSRLMVRLNLPYWIFEKQHPVLEPEETYDAQDIMMNDIDGNKLKSLISYNLDELKKSFTNGDNLAQAKQAIEYLLTTDTAKIDIKTIAGPVDIKGSFKDIIIRVMALPEYQLC